MRQLVARTQKGKHAVLKKEQQALYRQGLLNDVEYKEKHRPPWREVSDLELKEKCYDVFMRKTSSTDVVACKVCAVCGEWKLKLLFVCSVIRGDSTELRLLQGDLPKKYCGQMRRQME